MNESTYRSINKLNQAIMDIADEGQLHHPSLEWQMKKDTIIERKREFPGRLSSHGD